MEVNEKLTDKARRDFQLVRRALDTGDQHAYADLMKHYRDAIYFMMLKMTNNQLDAEDLTIEAFSKAFKNLPQYSPEYAFSTWLFKIASNNAIDYIRKQRLNVTSINQTINDEDDGEFSQNIPCHGPDPEAFFIRKQKIQLLREVVEKLKPHYRLLVEMRYFKEMSYEEIANELTLPVGTVKAQLFRARELMFNILKKQPDQI